MSAEPQENPIAASGGPQRPSHHPAQGGPRREAAGEGEEGVAGADDLDRAPAVIGAEGGRDHPSWLQVREAALGAGGCRRPRRTRSRRSPVRPLDPERGRSREQLLDPDGGREIGDQRLEPAAACPYLLGEGAQALAAASDRQHRMPPAGERDRELSPETGRGSGDLSGA
jgi:hypothetical protein